MALTARGLLLSENHFWNFPQQQAMLPRTPQASVCAVPAAAHLHPDWHADAQLPCTTHRAFSNEPEGTPHWSVPQS